MQLLEVSVAVGPLYGSLGVKGLILSPRKIIKAYLTTARTFRSLYSVCLIGYLEFGTVNTLQTAVFVRRSSFNRL